MSIELTEAQRQAFLKGEPVQVRAPELGEDAVLLRATTFEEYCDIVRDEREQAVFRAFARKQGTRLARENRY